MGPKLWWISGAITAPSYLAMVMCETLKLPAISISVFNN